MRISSTLLFAAIVACALASPAAAQVHFQPRYGESMNIPAGFTATSGPASPYGQRAIVSGMKNPILDVSIALDGFSHSSPDNLLIVLQSPSGTACVLSSGCWNADNAGAEVITFDDDAEAALPFPGACTHGTYRPSDCDPTASLASPGPTRPYGASLAVFDGEDANGDWLLWIDDLAEGNRGFLSTWTLTIQEDAPGGAVTYMQEISTDIPDDFGSGVDIGPAEQFPYTWNVLGLNGVVSSVAVRLRNLSHTCTHDLDIYLVAPGGAASSLLSDVGGCPFPGPNELEVAFTSNATEPIGPLLTSGTYAPTGDLLLGDPDDASSLAPPGANVDIPADFSVFDGIDPNGPWSLYIYNDSFGGSGRLSSWELTIHLAPPCTAEMTGDTPTSVDVFDLLAYLDLWFTQDGAAERTGDAPSAIDVFDLLAYLDAWFTGC